jgi:RNA polymerase sigma-70 factor, ECF subfamily
MSDVGHAEPPSAADVAFQEERPRLVGVAYRITGSRAEADDVVQEAWLRWQRADRAAIDRPAAWLTTVTSRLALDRLNSAQRRREAYVGPWLPEVASTEPGPEARAEIVESVTVGFLAVLERLGPVERVVFLLADVFGVPFDEIAPVVGRSVAACRQVASRARQRVRDERPRFTPTDEEAWAVTARFLEASVSGDVEALLAVVAPDVALVSDGGPDRHAARRPVLGQDRVARFVINLTRRNLGPSAEVQVQELNGQPAAIVRLGGTVRLVVICSVVDGVVDRVWTVLNPHKLEALDRPALR